MRRFTGAFLIAIASNCSSDSPVGLGHVHVIDGLRFEGRTAVGAEGQALVSVSIRNVATDEKRIVAVEGCNPVPQLYPTKDREGQPAWDGFALDEGSCLTVPLDFLLLPGQEKNFSSLLLPNEVKGDSLESQVYFVAASLKVNQDTVRVAAGQLTL